MRFSNPEIGSPACTEAAAMSILLSCEPGLHIPIERRWRLNRDQRPCDLPRRTRLHPAPGISRLPRSPGGMGLVQHRPLHLTSGAGRGQTGDWLVGAAGR